MRWLPAGASWVVEQSIALLHWFRRLRIRAGGDWLVRRCHSMIDMARFRARAAVTF